MCRKKTVDFKRCSNTVIVASYAMLVSWVILQSAMAEKVFLYYSIKKYLFHIMCSSVVLEIICLRGGLIYWGFLPVPGFIIIKTDDVTFLCNLIMISSDNTE